MVEPARRESAWDAGQREVAESDHQRRCFYWQSIDKHLHRPRRKGCPATHFPRRRETIQPLRIARLSSRETILESCSAPMIATMPEHPRENRRAAEKAESKSVPRNNKYSPRNLEYASTLFDFTGRRISRAADITK